MQADTGWIGCLAGVSSPGTSRTTGTSVDNPSGQNFKFLNFKSFATDFVQASKAWSQLFCMLLNTNVYYQMKKKSEICLYLWLRIIFSNLSKIRGLL